MVVVVAAAAAGEAAAAASLRWGRGAPALGGRQERASMLDRGSLLWGVVACAGG